MLIIMQNGNSSSVAQSLEAPASFALLELRSLLISVNTKFCFLALLTVHDHVPPMLLGQKLALVKPYHPPKTRIRSDDPFGLQIQKSDVDMFSCSHLLIREVSMSHNSRQEQARDFRFFAIGRVYGLDVQEVLSFWDGPTPGPTGGPKGPFSYIFPVYGL